jgi:hypothetical protein
MIIPLFVVSGGSPAQTATLVPRQKKNTSAKARVVDPGSVARVTATPATLYRRDSSARQNTPVRSSCRPLGGFERSPVSGMMIARDTRAPRTS